ncbi:M28 family peptidase [Paenibacillus antri]|nr:M28 family peptidase [Paenibacillus antri]
MNTVTAAVPVNTLLSRYGFRASDLVTPDSSYGALLDRALHEAGIGLDELPSISEQDWQLALRKARDRFDGPGGETLVDPRRAPLPLSSIDFYMAGVVRWMNELGIHTYSCCDGHGKRLPHANMISYLGTQQKHILQVSAPEGMSLRAQGRRVQWEMNPSEPERLLQFAERLYCIVSEPATLFRYEADRFAEGLVELLEIPGESGSEERIRRAAIAKLRRHADDLFVDRAGNVCAAILCGEGPTVLLSAHMDVFSEIEPERRIVRRGTELSSSEGILGADDRAGMAVILELCRRVHRTNFNGTLKVALTVREEIGLEGSQALDAAWLEDVRGAIVVDRRGTRDIVTSCGRVIPFCSEAYGRLFEAAGALAGMPDWRVTPGGSSDAKVLATEFGIPSVNLSAGYRHEHTSSETVDYLATYQTVKLIECVLHRNMIQ